jgi:hypothetical protein
VDDGKEQHTELARSSTLPSNIDLPALTMQHVSASACRICAASAQRLRAGSSLHAQLDSRVMADVAGDSVRRTHNNRVSEFVYFIALEGHVEALITEHVRTVSGICAGCNKPWPCNWRKLADQALEVLYRGLV